VGLEIRCKRSADHRTWSAFTVRRLLRNRSYLGAVAATSLVSP
jgi:hypothetical protein